jgi:uncharacterized protein YbjT (DUF2867 family)
MDVLKNVKKIAVTGATGFIGKNLIHYLLENTDSDIVALSRNEFTSENQRLETRKVDLYSLLECEKALLGCDVAIYLVHSMSPSSRLAQGHFEDFDFILADNFAKAAVKCNIQHIIYVSGIIPDVKDLSIHLKSRLEVEETLAQHSTPVTTLRCGLVIGKSGSSFRIVEKLIDRLPIMGLPSWTKTKLQVIYIKDLIQIISKVISEGPSLAGSFDVGAPEILEYQNILIEAARTKNRKTLFVPIRYLSRSFSKLWVRTISGTSKDLVYPLIDSLNHKMLVDEKRALPPIFKINFTSFSDSIKKSLISDQDPQLPLNKIKNLNENKYSLVQSVQRIKHPIHMSMTEVAIYYMNWLPQFLWPFFIIDKNNLQLNFYIKFICQPLLQLTLSKERTFDGRELFYITGGLLTIPHKKARMEFRSTCDNHFLIVAIHSFRPRLPWIIYKYSQAKIHQFVMYQFGKKLSRLVDQ